MLGGARFCEGGSAAAFSSASDGGFHEMGNVGSGRVEGCEVGG